MHLLPFFIIVLSVFSSSGCHEKKNNQGTLHIKSKWPGEYDVFQVKSESPPQVVAETIGYYNQDLRLNPGKYIILADCSSTTLMLSSNSVEILSVGELVLELPKTSFNEAFPLVQCERSAALGIKQKLQNRRTLQVLPTVQNILIGPAAFALEVKDLSSEHAVQTIPLAAIVVGSANDHGTYFVSGVNTAAPVSQAQELGKPIFLLPGQYLIELNGTHNQITIGPLETKMQTVGYFLINTPKNNTTLKLNERSEQNFVETKAGSIYELNKVHVVLPGILALRIGNTLYYHDISVEEQKTTNRLLESVVVISKCEPPEILCKKKQKVFLFQNNNPYYFSQGFTNEAIYHWFSDPIKISLNTTESIFRTIPAGTMNVTESIGRLELHFKKNNSPLKELRTNFLRIYPTSRKMEGESYDIEANAGTTHYNLFTGSYRLVHHLFREGRKNYDAIAKNVVFRITEGKTTHLVVEVF